MQYENISVHNLDSEIYVCQLSLDSVSPTQRRALPPGVDVTPDVKSPDGIKDGLNLAKCTIQPYSKLLSTEKCSRQRQLLTLYRPP
jgi:hypothetical protein